VKARDVVGRKIVRVEQDRISSDGSHAGCWAIRAIVLDDGTEISFSVHEIEADYAVEARVWKPGRETSA